MDAIAKAMSVSTAPKEAKTAKEISEEQNIPLHSVMLALHSYAKQGRLMAHRVKREAIDGSWRTRSAYTILAKPKK